MASPKNLFRLLLLATLAFFAWTCNVSDSGKGDTILTLTVGDSLKASAGKYDSIQIRVMVVNGSDTSYNKIVFDGAYSNATQLQSLNLGKLPSNDFTIILSGYRQGAVVLVLALPFTGGKAGTPVLDSLIPPQASVLRMWLSPPDSGLNSLQIKEGITLAFQVMAKDSNAKDTAVLLHFINPLPSACGSPSYDSVSGNFSFKPAFACVDSGGATVMDTLKFMAKDKSNPPVFDTLRLSLIVLDSNSAPKWKEDTVSNLSDKQGRSISLALDSLYLGDAEGDAVSFTASLGNITQNPLGWSFTPSFSDSGVKTITLTATDSHHPPASSSLVLKLAIADSIRAFNVIITSPQNGYVTRDSVIAVHWSVNGINQTTDTTEHLMKQGANGVTRVYHDTLTNSSYSDSITVTRDTVPPNKPNVHVTSPTNNQRPTWNWESGGGGDGYFRQRLDTASFIDTVGAKDTSFTPGTNLAAGSHVLYVEERDDAGNWSAMASASVSIVLSGPLVVVTSPPNNYVTRQASVDVYWTLNGVAQTKVTKNLIEGTNTLFVGGADSAGNKDSTSVTVIRDTVPPNKPVVTGPGLTNSQKPTWTWHSGGGGGAGYYRYKLDTMSLTDTVGMSDSSFAPTANLVQDRHVFYIEERDAVGNWSLMDSSGIARIDITPPVVQVVSPADSFVTNQSSVQVTWKVDGVNQTADTVNLSEGVNTIKDSATDSAGNVGRAAITITRKSNVLFVNASAAANGDGNSWTSAYRYLQPAIARSTSGQQIWVAQGTYKPAQGLTNHDSTYDTSFVMKSGVIWLGGFKGTENDSGKRNWSSNESALSGQKVDTTVSTSNPIIYGADNSTIDGFTVEKAFVQGTAGAMINSGTSPQIFNCFFRDNKNDVSTRNAGPGAMTTSGSPIIQNCTFFRNIGNRYTGGILILSGSPIIKNGVFDSNSTSGNGGAILIAGGSPIISLCFFQKNQASYGGAISDASTYATILNNVFIENVATIGGGGYDEEGSSVVENNIFMGNVATEGGAIYAFDHGLNLVNSTLFGNTASDSGGGVFLTTIAGYHNSNIIKNSILWGNAGEYSEDAEIALVSDSISSDTLNISYTDLSGGIQNIAKYGPIIINDSSNILMDPEFKNTASFIGPDGKYLTSDDGLNLSPGSPCINSGDPNTSGLPATDITGAPRVQSGQVDMGAYEQ